MPKTKSFRLHQHKHSPSGWALVGLAGLLAVGAWFVSPLRERPNAHEESVALEQNRVEFLEEVEASDGEWVNGAGAPIWQNKRLAMQPVKFPDLDLATLQETAQEVLGFNTAADGCEKWIEVDISDKKLWAKECDRVVYDMPISSGKPGDETPRGEFRVWKKVKYKAFRGGSRARGDYYYLPNVPFSLFYSGPYAIHGAYWHTKFGLEDVSHGCVNLDVSDSEKLWHWAPPAVYRGRNTTYPTRRNPGTRIVIHD